MADREKNEQERDLSWIWIVLLFAAELWPFALILLFLKLFGSDKKEKSAAKQTNRAQQAVQKVTKSPKTKKSNAMWLKIIGGVMVGIGVLGCADAIGSMAIGIHAIGDLLSCLAIAVGGGAMFMGGIGMERSMMRYAKYLAVMSDREVIAIEELSRTLGYSERRVEKDLQNMIDKGYFGGKAYLNIEKGRLFRSSEANAAWAAAQKAAEEPKNPTEAEEGFSGILRNIRRANDRIADPVLSGKIDRLEAITGRIFKAVEDDPSKRSRIDTFLNYYIPTTQKLLDSYAEFEAAGVEGENLRQAKQRIASTMDGIIKGFAHQLDELYKIDAMDVDSDIRVMETMLKRDTASAAEDFGMGATAVQNESE